MKDTRTKSKGAMPLAELAEEYIKSPTRGLSRDSATRLRRVAADFSDWLGCPATTGHLSEEVIDRFLNWRRDGISESTAERLRKSVVMLWRFAGELGFPPPPFRPHCRTANLAPVQATSKVELRRETTSKNEQLDRIEEMLGQLRGGGVSRVDRQDSPTTAPRRLEPTSRLADLLARYIEERALSPNTQSFHRSTLRSFERFLKRMPLVLDIGEDAIAGYIAWRRETSKAATCDRVRDTLNGWWRFAAELRLLEPPAPPLGLDQELAGCLHDLAAQNAAVTTQKPSLSLAAALKLYESERLSLGSESTVRQLRINVKRLGTFLGRSPQASDLTNEVVRESISKMVQNGLAARTANKFRDNMLAMWRFLAQRGILTTWPDVKAAVEPRRVPTAWTREQLAKLWAACEAQRGFIGEVPAKLWWHALHAVAWDTGERISGLLSIRRDDVDLERQWIVIRAENRKGRREDKASRLHPTTCDLLRQILSPSREMVFPWPFNHAYLWTRYKTLLLGAELPHDRTHKFHCLRKSVASYFEAAGGSATDALGHSDSRITKRHYIDPRIVITQSAADLLFRPDAKSLKHARARDAAGNSVNGTRDANLARLVEQWAMLSAELQQNVLRAAGVVDQTH